MNINHEDLVKDFRKTYGKEPNYTELEQYANCYQRKIPPSKRYMEILSKEFSKKLKLWKLGK